MKNREDKKKDFEDLRKALETVHNVFVTGYEKMTVDQDYNLRKTIRGAGGSYKVIKNNVAEKASGGSAGRTGSAGSEGDDVAGLDLGRSGGSGQGAHRLRQDDSGIHFQGGPGRRPRSRYQGNQRAGELCLRRKRFSPSCLYVINAPAQRLVTTSGRGGTQSGCGVDQGVKENKFQS